MWLRPASESETYVLKEDFQNTSRLFVDQARDTLHTATTSETTDGGLRDTLDVVAQNLPVTFGAAFSESLQSWLEMTSSRN